MTLKDYLYNNKDVGYGALWILLENIIDHCLEGDIDRYGYTSKGRIYNKQTKETICKVDYYIDWDGSRKVYFLDNIKEVG